LDFYFKYALSYILYQKGYKEIVCNNISQYKIVYKNMPNYQLGKIYKIVCNTSGLVYYGSTCEPTLARRLAGHRGNFELWKKNNKLYVSSYKVLENKNYDIVLVELVPCNSKMELHKRERFFIENNVCVNMAVPLRSNLEYKSDHKEELSEKQKTYNKSHLKDKANYDAMYCLKNSDKIKEYNKKTYECECGKTTTIRHHARHDLSLQHIAFINNKPL
jgi:hypothetical protein